MLLREVALVRFKAFESATVQAAPITVLIGPNNAGKSTVLQALALIAQSVASTSSGVLRPVGPLVDLGGSLAELANDKSGPGAGWEIKLSWRPEPARDPSFEIGYAIEVGPQLAPQSFITAAWARRELPRGREVEARVTWGTQEQQRLTISAPGISHGLVTAPPIDKAINVNAGSPWQWIVAEAVQTPNEVDAANGEPEAVIAAIIGSAMPYFFGGIAQQLLAFHYVGPDRQIVRSVVPLSGIDNPNPQTAEDVVNALAFGDQILGRVSETLRTTFQYGVDKALFRGQPQRVGDVGPQVGLVGTAPGGRRRNIVNMGAGFTQFGWIALQLELARLPKTPYYGSSPPATPVVGVEEPELHLHPKQQLAVARLLADFALGGGQVLCTTQSEHFLLAILELVLDGTLNRDQVAVHYLEAGAVQPLEVDEKGRLQGGLRGFLESNEERVKRQIDLLRKSANLDS